MERPPCHDPSVLRADRSGSHDTVRGHDPTRGQGWGARGRVPSRVGGAHVWRRASAHPASSPRPDRTSRREQLHRGDVPPRSRGRLHRPDRCDLRHPTALRIHPGSRRGHRGILAAARHRHDLAGRERTLLCGSQPLRRRRGGSERVPGQRRGPPERRSTVGVYGSRRDACLPVPGVRLPTAGARALSLPVSTAARSGDVIRCPRDPAPGRSPRLLHTQPQRGGLMVASYGRGTYVYAAYSFFRQIPEGVPGAIRLFANLLGLAEARVMARAEQVRNIPLLSFLSDEERYEVARLMSERWLDAGTVLCRQGDRGSDLYMVLEGEVQVLKSEGSAERTVAAVGPGEVVGELAAIADLPRSATLLAGTDVKILVMRGPHFREFLGRNADLSGRVTALLARRLASAEIV